jgi:hypothetical protein
VAASRRISLREKGFFYSLNVPHHPRALLLRASVWMRWLADQPVVLGVWTDPKPHDSSRGLDADRTVMGADSRRPEATNFLEVKRWISRVPFQLLEAPVRETLNRNGKRAIALPELRRCVVIQSLVVVPDAWACSAFSASASSFPARTSASN